MVLHQVLKGCASLALVVLVNVQSSHGAGLIRREEPHNIAPGALASQAGLEVKSPSSSAGSSLADRRNAAANSMQEHPVPPIPADNGAILPVHRKATLHNSSAGLVTTPI